MLRPGALVGLCAALAAAAASAGDTDTLIGVVNDPKSPVAAAKKAIAQLGDAQEPRAVPTLIKVLYQQYEGRTLAPEASFALFQIGRPSADGLLRVIQNKDPELRAWATAHRVPDTWLLAEAATVLGDLGDPRAQAPLLALLEFESSNKDLELVVRRRAANALGRLHSKAATSRLAALAGITNLQARHEAVRALVQIGGRSGLPALSRTAATGAWEVRQIGIDGFTMLGDDRERPAFEKMLQHEEEVITSDCRAHPNYQGCNDQPALLARMLGRIRGFGKRLEAAARCKQDPTCWTERLKDADAGVRERAVLELARRLTGKQVEPLFAAVEDQDAAVELAAVQSLEWLLARDAAARAVGQRHVQALETRLAKGAGTVAGARFDAPLRRIVHRIHPLGLPRRGQDIRQGAPRPDR